MAINDALDSINLTTRRYIRDNPALVDGVYNQDALNYYLRDNLRDDFTGGNSINEDFIYTGMIGGGYQKGKTFNIQQKQTEQQMTFDMKYQQVSVPLYQEDTEVLNKGPLAVIKLLKARVDQAYMTLGENVSIGTYLNGQNAGYLANMNGLAEALNDGTNASWDGNTYPVYGRLTRSLYPGIQSAPVNLAGGSIEYDTIDLQYMSVFFGAGKWEPNLMITTTTGFSYIKSKFQSQQRFVPAKLDVGVGFRGLEFNGATLLATRLAPGSYLTGPTGAGTADPIATQYLNTTSDGAVTTYPVGSLGNSGETLFILNARKPFLNYYVATGMYGGNFRDFIPTANNTIIVGQVLLGHQLTVFPRYHRQLFGFAS